MRASALRQCAGGSIGPGGCGPTGLDCICPSSFGQKLSLLYYSLSISFFVAVRKGIQYAHIDNNINFLHFRFFKTASFSLSLLEGSVE